MYSKSSALDAKSNPGFMTVQNRVAKAQKIEAILADYLGKPIQNAKILDVGCGNGAISDYFAKNNEVFAIDLVDQRTDPFKSNSVHFLKYVDHKIPLESQSFDIVISNHVLAYIGEKNSHVEELARLLKPGGIIYFATPNRLFPVEPHFGVPFLHYLPTRIFNRVMKKLGLFRENVFLTNSFELRRLLKQWGLDPIDYTPRVIKFGQRFGMQSRDLSWLPDWISLLSPTLIMIALKK